MSEVNTATRPTGPSPASRVARLRMASFGAVTMLIIQFILGIVYNLYGTAPTAFKSVGLFSSPVLALHVIMSLLLLIAAVMLLVRAIGARHRLTIWMSAVGLIGIVAAGGAGIAFAGNGAAGSSLGMSIAFAVSLASYVVILVFVPAQSA
ncbi:MAG: hypothetical protein ABSB76_14245 [Streptosporangiaceae bacterium]|jgi:hypothetical protein